MPLIKCYECGKNISDKALSCPHCGAPTHPEPIKTEEKSEPVHNLIHKSRKAEMEKEKKTFSIISKSVIALIIIIVFFRPFSHTITEEATEETIQKNEITKVQKEAAMQVITLNGYTCDSIAGMSKFITSEGYNVYCNDHRYNYEIENKGGNWVVTVK